MEKGNSGRFLSYIFLLATFFAILFILDRVFELHYAPEEHRLNKPEKGEKVEGSGGHSADIHEMPEDEPNDKAEVAVEEENNESEPIKEDSEEVASTEMASSGDYFMELKKKYEAEILSALPANKARTDVVIRYYRHPPDGNSAYELEKLGFYIHERPVEDQYEDFQSNAIFYGDSVATRDLQLVAYTLLKAGLPIKVIKPSRFGDSWKSRSIEIGTDTTLVAQPTLSLTEIQNITK